MTTPRDESPQMHRSDQQVVERLVAHYTPTPMTPSQRVAFDDAIWRRIKTRRHLNLWVPVLATAMMALVIGVLILTEQLPFAPDQGDAIGTATVTAQRRATPWEYELMFASEQPNNAPTDNSRMLPDDYVAIAQVFLDDTYAAP